MLPRPNAQGICGVCVWNGSDDSSLAGGNSTGEAGGRSNGWRKQGLGSAGSGEEERGTPEPAPPNSHATEIFGTIPFVVGLWGPAEKGASLSQSLRRNPSRPAVNAPHSWLPGAPPPSAGEAMVGEARRRTGRVCSLAAVPERTVWDAGSVGRARPKCHRSRGCGSQKVLHCGQPPPPRPTQMPANGAPPTLIKTSLPGWTNHAFECVCVGWVTRGINGHPPPAHILCGPPPRIYLPPFHPQSSPNANLGKLLQLSSRRDTKKERESTKEVLYFPGRPDRRGWPFLSLPGWGWAGQKSRAPGKGGDYTQSFFFRGGA